MEIHLAGSRVLPREGEGGSGRSRHLVPLPTEPESQVVDVAPGNRSWHAARSAHGQVATTKTSAARGQTAGAPEVGAQGSPSAPATRMRRGAA